MKSGPTAGEKSGPTAGEKSNANSRLRRAHELEITGVQDDEATMVQAVQGSPAVRVVLKDSAELPVSWLLSCKGVLSGFHVSICVAAI